jgi:hypothetical protein
MPKNENQMNTLQSQCATEHCKDAAETGQPHCAECTMVSIWAADAAKKRELGIYPSRETGNHSVDRIDAIQAGSRERAIRRRAQEIARNGAALCSDEQVETVIREEFDLEEAEPASSPLPWWEQTATANPLDY